MIDEKPSYRMRQLWEALSELTYSEMRKAAALFSEAMGDVAGYETKVEKIDPSDWMEALDMAAARWKIELGDFETAQAKKTTAKADAS